MQWLLLSGQGRETFCFGITISQEPPGLLVVPEMIQD